MVYFTGARDSTSRAVAELGDQPAELRRGPPPGLLSPPATGTRHSVLLEDLRRPIDGRFESVPLLSGLLDRLDPCDYSPNMRTISVAVSESDYEIFRRAARTRNRSAAQLIREAMAYFRAEKLEERPRLTDLPVLAGHRPLVDLPTRAEVYEEMFSGMESPSR